MRYFGFEEFMLFHQLHVAIGCACIEFFHIISNDKVLGYEFNEDSALSFMYKDQKSED